jgi:phosphate transport system substrate-binding protein
VTYDEMPRRKWPSQCPGGAGGKGNEGVAAFVASSKGTIGYVEYVYAKQKNLAPVMMENHDGKYVAPGALVH